MCELLVFTRDDPGPMRYKRGDVVDIMPDGHQWGRLEQLPPFRIIQLPGVAIDDVRHLAEPTLEAAGEIRQRRLWRLDLDSIESVEQLRIGRALQDQDRIPMTRLALLGFASRRSVIRR